MRRREFLIISAMTAAWPRAAIAQSNRTIPVLGFLVAGSGLMGEKRMAAFRQGLREMGYIEGENVSFLILGGDGKPDRLRLLAEDLIQRGVSAIIAPQSSVAAVAARDATKVIPIIFSVTADPVVLGLVASLARPGGNATGVNTFSTELAAKRLGLLRDLLPSLKVVGVLFNPATPVNQAALSEVHTAANTLGLEVRVVMARSMGEIDAAFEEFARERADAILVINDPLFSSRNAEIALLTVRHALPAIYSQRELAEVGGLMSYGTSLADVYRQLGVYAGRVLRGDKPAELPVQQSTKFELVINLKAANALGITIPPTLLTHADEVIE